MQPDRSIKQIWLPHTGLDFKCWKFGHIHLDKCYDDIRYPGPLIWKTGFWHTTLSFYRAFAAQWDKHWNQKESDILCVSKVILAPALIVFYNRKCNNSQAETETTHTHIRTHRETPSWQLEYVLTIYILYLKPLYATGKLWLRSCNLLKTVR